jgi:hypothetical protein
MPIAIGGVMDAIPAIIAAADIERDAIGPQFLLKNP